MPRLKRPAAQAFLPTSVLRLSAVYIVVFSIAVSLLLGLLYGYVARALDRQTDEVIEAELQGLAEQYSTRGLDGLTAVIEERARTGGRTGDLYLLADPDLRPLAGNLALWPKPVQPSDRWIEFDVSVSHGTGFESHRVRAGLFTLPDGHRLLVGDDIRERERFKRLIGWTLLASIVIVIATGAVLGIGMNRRVLGRVDAISGTARRIVDGHFSERLARSGTGDEFDALARSLNQMLDQIEHLTAALRFVIDSTAHDLRSPLHRLRARIEASLDDDDPAAARRTLEATLRDAEHLQRTLNSLLNIAQAQGGGDATEFAPVDLDALAAEMAELYEPAASDRGIVLAARRSGPAVVQGSRQLLAHAVANLIDNALKYTPGGGRVEIGAACRGDRVALIVADTGPGIPADDRDKALLRFVRLQDRSPEDEARAPGTGLGLSLVYAVARLHQAGLSLADNAPGLRVTLEFQAAVGDQLRGARADGTTTRSAPGTTENSAGVRPTT
jgi:signal transduction histidine kinase